jgi:hypothetical protein
VGTHHRRTTPPRRSRGVRRMDQRGGASPRRICPPLPGGFGWHGAVACVLSQCLCNVVYLVCMMWKYLLVISNHKFCLYSQV